jgi:hypothetical protein
MMYHLIPDWVFALCRGFDNKAKPVQARNFYLELQRSNGVVKDPKRLRSRHKSLRHRLEGYYYYYKEQRWLSWAPVKQRRYSAMKESQNLRVLFVTEGMGPDEHNKLIELAREIDEKRIGLRLFLFLRLEDLGQNPVQTIAEPVWRTPVIGDELKSILA